MLVSYRFVLTIMITFTTTAVSQWFSQTIVLNPGWNAVFLEVQPEPNECDILFENLAIDSVCGWKERFASAEFINDSLVIEQQDLLKYFPTNSMNHSQTDLFSIQGGRSYLIKYNGNQSFNWVVKGQPLIRPPDWVADSYNFTGFSVDPTSLPTFTTFFSASQHHTGKPVYRITSQGKWEKITNAVVEKIQSGEAYWIYCDGQSSYSGPLNVTFEQGRSLNFSRILTEITLYVKNETSTLQRVSLKQQSSETPPSSFPTLAGTVVLSYWSTDSSKWMDLPQQLLLNIKSREQIGLRLRIQRQKMPDMNGALYQSMLELTDSKGIRLILPVSAKGKSDNIGLWVGSATINKVNFAADLSDPFTPKSTVSEFPIRLIVHVNNEGQVKLLQHVTLIWKDGTEKPDPEDPTKNIVDKPGEFVLLTRDDLMAQYNGSLIRNGELAYRRISSAVFSFSKPQIMTGEFEGKLECTGLSINYDDPLNPFKHKYHPDHDNLKYDFATKQTEGRDSYTVVRDIELEFMTEDTNGQLSVGWGDNKVGGFYREKIRGIHKKELNVEGFFKLEHISHIANLNDGLGD